MKKPKKDKKKEMSESKEDQEEEISFEKGLEKLNIAEKDDTINELRRATIQGNKKIVVFSIGKNVFNRSPLTNPSHAILLSVIFKILIPIQIYVSPLPIFVTVKSGLIIFINEALGRGAIAGETILESNR